jgi:hypothetical protein
MIYITTWQWAMELLLNIFIWLLAKGSGNFLVLEKLLVIVYGFFVWVILPSFYLMGDSNFRNEFDQAGFRRAFWQQLKNFKE